MCTIYASLDKDDSHFIGFRLGFKSITTIKEVCDAFPELDMVNHMNRAKLVCRKRKYLNTYTFFFFQRVKSCKAKDLFVMKTFVQLMVSVVFLTRINTE